MSWWGFASAWANAESLAANSLPESESELLASEAGMEMTSGDRAVEVPVRL